MEHDIHEMCEWREKVAFAFVSFAHFTSFVIQTLAPQAEVRLAELGPLQAEGVRAWTTISTKCAKGAKR